MSTDSQLLEQAAKAAGHEWQWFGANFNVRRPDGLWGQWNPITDDGDALRLAVTCKLTVCTDGDATVSACEAFKPETGAFATQSVSECADKNAATRRAIVRAAAEIGRAMPCA